MSGAGGRKCRYDDKAALYISGLFFTSILTGGSLCPVFSFSLREKERVAERLFRDNRTRTDRGLFHTTLPGDTGKALCPAVNSKQDESLAIEYPASTHQSSKGQKQPQAGVATRNNAVA